MLSKNARSKIKSAASQAIFNRKNEEIKNKIEKIKKNFIQEFKDHPITVEIMAGPMAENISGTLNGNGNLFSFIGFEKDSDPIQPIINVLNSLEIKIRKSNDNVFIYIKFPTPEDIWEVTPMPWQSGRSWAKGIESGISGLNYYLFYDKPKKIIDIVSRSGTAVQSSKRNNLGRYIPTKYISDLLKKYKTKFSSFGKRSISIFTEVI